MRRLVLCLDGTWNMKEDTTNVWRLSALVAATDAANNEQLVYYDQGVGTRWYDRLTGGAFGAGILANVREAYCWLAETYSEGDLIYLFGFSRGAFTALSLANLIDRCGIIRPHRDATFAEAYRLYRLPGFTRTAPAAVRFRTRGSSASPSDSPLQFLGLWDTVGSLFARKLFDEDMHVTEVPSSIKVLRHALAIDEYRALFQPIIFHEAPNDVSIEQRWFSGAHGNVGGGYAFDPMALAPLHWMLVEAKNAGLALRNEVTLNLSQVVACEERNSYQEFAFGASALVHPLLYRPRTIGSGVCEVIDASALARHHFFPSYGASCKPLQKILPPNFSHQEHLNVSSHSIR